MLSTLHGKLNLLVAPVKELPVSNGGRAEICRVRGIALGQLLNITVTLDVNTGEILLFSPDGFTGSFRMGDLVAAQIAGQVARAQQQRIQEGEAHVAQTH